MGPAGVSILMVRALAHAVEEAGVPVTKLLEAAGLHCGQLDELDTRLTFADYGRVQRAAIELTGNPALGLHLGVNAKSAAFDLIGHLNDLAPTLRHAVDSVLHYSRMLADEPGVILVEQGTRASLRFTFPAWPASGLRMAAELAVSGALRMLRTFVGADARPLGAYFAYPAPAYRAEYERIFGDALHFEHAFTGIDFESAWLERGQLHGNAELHAVLESQAQRNLQRLCDGRSLTERLRMHLSACNPRSMPDMADVARSFGMSARSLRRRLDAEGCDFRGLTEDARAEIARRLLGDPTRSIQEVAHRMGFATPAGFHRAFKRWTGETPSRFRAR